MESIYTKEECLKWKLNKLINPKTNRKIKQGKGLYNKIFKQCSHHKTPSPQKDKPSTLSPIKDKLKSKLLIINDKDKFTKEECLKWKLNKLINPKTNRKIAEGKEVYNKILKQCSHYNSHSPIKDKSKSKEKEKVKEQDIYIINKSLLKDLDKNQVILDPAGLNYMQDKFSGAGGASGQIYKILSTDKPTKDVIDYFLQFKSADDLYEKNKKNISVSRYASYNNNTINIIHTVGPDFRRSNYLKKIINNDDLTNLYKLYYKIYNDVYNEFISRYNKNNKLELILLILSTGIFINHDKEFVMDHDNVN